MSFAAQVLRKTVRKLLFFQLSVVLLTAAAYLLAKGGAAALAAGFGGGIALVNTLVSAQRLRKATEAAATDARRGMLELYLGALTRFIGTPALIAVGIVLLELDPVAIIVGFAVAQVAYLLNGVETGTGKSHS